MKENSTVTTEPPNQNGESASRHRSANSGHWLMAAIATVSLGTAHSSQAETQIPATFVLPVSAADTSQPGFIWRVHQLDSWQPNENTRTEMQLAGLLGDNLADPAAMGVAISPASPPSPPTAPIRFDLAGVVNLNIPGFGNEGNFVPDDLMPGIPGTTGGYENVAGEILTWLDLPAGTITLGVNSDDGFLMTLGGSGPLDKFAPKVGEFNGGRPAGDSLFEIVVAKAGLHAVRCTWEQGCCGANVELFSILPDGTRVLLNDVANGGIPAYRAVTTPDRAYARSITPAPNTRGASALGPIVVELVDGAFPIDATSASLSLDGVVVPTIKSKSGSVTRVSHSPKSPFAEGSRHTAELTYIENGVSVQAAWSFTVAFRIGPNGHVYEVVLVGEGITWPDAEAAAKSQGGSEVVSHLATITSYEEDLFLERLRQESPPDRPDGQLWVGGYQDKNSPDYWEPGGGWVWVNGEGSFNSYNWGWPYTNWQWWWQPDNAYTDLGGSEDYLAIGLSGNFGWNDDGFDGGGRRDGTLGGYIVEYEPIALLMDIMPGDTTNAVNLVAKGKLPVAVLSTPTFDPTQLDVTSIRFGRTGTETTPVSWSNQDVNKDKRIDLLLQFGVQDLELLCDDVEAVLTAQTLKGSPAIGRDSIRVVKCPHYSLAATAMMDVNGVADMELVVQSLTGDAYAPSAANQVQLKSFDAMGHLHWTQNFQSVPLQQWSSYQSVGTLQFNGAMAQQPVKVKAQVTDSNGKNTEVIHTQTVVKLRPDLAVESLLVPPNADACSIVNIVANLREMNGDLGANAIAYLYDGDQMVDAAWVWLEPSGSADVVFSRIFNQDGPHMLKVVVSDVSPGDYDVSNNTSATTSIEIGQRAVSASYSASYTGRIWEYQLEEQNPYYSSIFRESGKTESLWAYFSLTPYAQFPFQDVAIQFSADGALREDIQLGALEADYIYSDGSYYDASAYRQIGDSASLYLRAYSYGACSDAVAAEIYRSSADVVYHSEYHDFYWGTTDVYDVEYQYGNFMDAGTSFEIRLVLTHESGVLGGTTGPIPIIPYPFNNEWNNEWPDGGFYRGYYRGEEFYGYGFGELTP